MTDHNLRDIASRCEAKLHGLRRTAEGAVISFVIHPNEIPRALMLDPLGTRYMLAFVAIGDDEQPISASPHDAGERPLSVTRPAQQGLIHSDDHAAEYRKYTDRGNAQAATAKARAAMTAGEHARSRAGRLPREDERFRYWAAIEKAGFDAPGMCALSEDDAAQFIRDRCCGGKSRRLIAEDPDAMDRFIDLETRFKIAVGELPEPR